MVPSSCAHGCLSISDPSTPPKSVEEWLASLQLLDYLETFRSHGYDTIDKVQSILWELQLRTVCSIHRLPGYLNIVQLNYQFKSKKKSSGKYRFH